MLFLRQFYLICTVAVLSSCNTNSNSPHIFELSYPSHFPDPVASPSRNPLTVEGVALGQKLFFDTSLSADGKISCATCHQPNKSFSDGQPFSVGHSGKHLKRNTPPIINPAWQNHFFWDGGVKNLESLSFAALMNADEMGNDLAQLCTKINSDPVYRKDFEKAFGVDSISSAFISRALAQYMRTLTTANTKYDSVQMKLSSFSEPERRGLIVFEKNCAGCHTPPLFLDNSFHHNGIQQSYSTENLHLNTGRFRITRDSSDLGKYKTPTLRNWNQTAPYMHDGRFGSIEQVVDHYQNIDRANQFQDSIVKDVAFNDAEKSVLMSFLGTLNEKKK